MICALLVAPPCENYELIQKDLKTLLCQLIDMKSLLPAVMKGRNPTGL